MTTVDKQSGASKANASAEKEAIEVNSVGVAQASPNESALGHDNEAYGLAAKKRRRRVKDRRQGAPVTTDRRTIESLENQYPANLNDRDLDNLISSGRQIANMAEPVLLSSAELKANRIIHPNAEDAKAVDTYRELRTKLLQASNGDNPVTLVTAVTSKGGATHVALNVAAAYAFDETKTSMVVDCNLQNPALHERLYLDPQCGLTDFLEREVIGLESIIYATGIPRLRIIPAGGAREHASEYFTSLRMKALLDVLKRRYTDRHIFLDGPSITESADARILADLADQIVLVVPYGKAVNSQIQRAIDAIDPSKLAGVIVND